jgi:hypothetical protein
VHGAVTRARRPQKTKRGDMRDSGRDSTRRSRAIEYMRLSSRRNDLTAESWVEEQNVEHRERVDTELPELLR